MRSSAVGTILALVIRYEGPRANGMPEMYFAAAILSSDRALNATTAIVTDGRYSGAMRGPRIGHVAPEAIDGGPIALVAENDLIEINVPERRLAIVDVDAATRRGILVTKETYHRIGEAELRRMKPTLILVNTARGPIINDDALCLALQVGWIAGAGLDDIEEEPAKQRDWKPANPLFRLDNVIITPHAAYYSEEAIRTLRDFAAHEVARVLIGQPPLSPVNAAQLAKVQPHHSP
jgi:Dehydratase family/D-isomer specific 2-hydroxyacid dehydrogenase, NAD binding domain